jgi:hypothetical protein
VLHPRPRDHVTPLLACAAIAAALHVFAVPVLPVVLAPADEQPLERDRRPSQDDTPLVINTITEEELAELLEDEPEDPPELPDEDPPEEAPEEPETPPLVEVELQKDVLQENNSETPTEAKFVSDNANKVEEETVAEETTFVEALPGDSVPEDVAEATTPTPDVENVAGDDAPEAPDAPPEEPAAEVAMAVKPPIADTKPPVETFGPISEEWKESQPDPEAPGERPPVEQPPVDSPVVKKKPDDPKLDPNQMKGLFNPTVGEVAKIYADDPIGEVRPTRRKRRVLARHAKRQRLMRASLENMISEVKPGNHTSVNAQKAVYAGYIGAIHRRIHARWANQYLPMLDTRQTFDPQLSDPTLMTKLEFVIDADSGEFEAVNVVKSSGVLAYDAEAIDTAWSIGRRPNAPAPLVSPNGKVYVHWSFWRDGRQCGVFGAAVYIVNKDGSRKKTDAPDEPDHAHEH